MRAELNALTEELKRLKASGVRTVAVSDESIAALRAAAARNAGAKAETPKAEVPRTGIQGTEGRVSEVRRVEAPRAEVETPKGPSLGPVPTVVLPASGAKAARWAALRDLVLADKTCGARVRPGRKVVFGVGNIDADIMFVGEAPGADEEVQGEPFVGPAGQLLNKMITGMGLQRGDVYIGNIMNWRPEMPVNESGIQYGNRPPTPEEMAYCLPYLKAQIEVVNPKLLVALGATAAQGLLGQGTFKALGEIRGQWREFAGKPLMVTYHPSYILRNQSNRSKRMIWEDFLKVMEKAGLPITAKQRGYFLDKA